MHKTQHWTDGTDNSLHVTYTHGPRKEDTALQSHMGVVFWDTANNQRLQEADSVVTEGG